MQKRRLGQTNMDVSVLGLGTVKWGRNQGIKYPQSFSIPDETALSELLHRAKEHGINLIDTAPAYGESETRLGRLLKESRHDWVICTKAGEEFIDGKSIFDFSKKAIIQSVERSLTRLQTDYLDVVLIHSNGEDITLIEQYGVLDTLQHLKEKGYVRAIGMSTKTVVGGMRALDYSDVVMVTSRPDYMDEAPVMQHAATLTKGVLIKKALASGYLSTIAECNPVTESLKFNLAYQAVSSIIIGTISMSHLDENCAAVSSFSNVGQSLIT